MDAKAGNIDGDKMTMAILMGAMSVYLALIMTVLDGNIVNVALPSMSKHFGVSRSAIVWVVNAYQIVIMMLLLALAALGDIKGYKKVFLFGVAMFTIGSGACAASFSYSMLLISRAIEGIGAAAIMSVNIALIRLVYPRKFLSRGLSYNAIIVGAATAVGPTLAGAILSFTSWHWLFIINIPIGMAALLVGIKHLPSWKPSDTEKCLKFDKVSAVESAIVLGLFVNVIEEFSSKSSHWLTVLQVAVIVVLGFFFMRRQIKSKFPLLPVDLFRNRSFTGSISSSTVNFMSTMLALVSLPFFLKEDLGYDVLHVGLLIAPWPLALIVASYIAGRIGNKVNLSTLSAIGMAIAAIGLWLLYVEPTHGGFWDIAWRMAICGFGFGIFKTPNNVLLVKSAPLDRTGAAGGMKSTARLLGQCVGTALVAIIFRNATVAHSSRLCLLLGVICAVAAMLLSLIAINRPENHPCACAQNQQSTDTPTSTNASTAQSAGASSTKAQASAPTSAS